MTEEANCYECDTPLTTICPRCNPYLSVAHSPDGEEVKRVATAIAKLDGVDFEKRGPITGFPLDTWRSWEPHARAAIAAMRPTLSEEDRAQLKINVAWYQANEKRFEAWCHDPDDGQTAFDMLGEALSLIDKLAGEG